jgi:hypothetical protein
MFKGLISKANKFKQTRHEWIIAYKEASVVPNVGNWNRNRRNKTRYWKINQVNG